MMQYRLRLTKLSKILLSISIINFTWFFFTIIARDANDFDTYGFPKIINKNIHTVT